MLLMILVILLLASLVLAFANGANDNFKGVATLLGSGTTSYRAALAWATVTTLLGSLAAVLLNHGQGATGNVITCMVVIGASSFGVPISTTHVSCGALFGIGAVTQQARWSMIGKILAARVTTLPLGAILGAASYWMIDG